MLNLFNKKFEIMKKIVVMSIAFLMVIAANAQNPKKVHIKMTKDINGEVTVLDTIIEGNEGDFVYYNAGDFSDKSLDSLMEKFMISSDAHKIKVICSDNIKAKADSGNMVWVSVKSDDEIEGVVKKTIALTVSEKGSKSVSNSNSFTFFEGDSIIHMHDIVMKSDGKDFYVVTEDGGKIVVNPTESGEVFIWSVDSADDKKIEFTKDVKIYSGSDNNIKIIKSKDGNAEITAVSEVFVKKGDGDCKTIDLLISTDNNDGEEIIKELEQVLEGKAENVKVYSYETEDGKVIIKATISDCDLTKEEEQEIKSLGLEDKTELQVKNFKLYPNPTEGLFNLEFELEENAAAMIKIYNQKGEMVYNEKIKKSELIFNKQIDLSKEESGIYFIKIIQFDKSITKKVMKK